MNASILRWFEILKCCLADALRGIVVQLVAEGKGRFLCDVMFHPIAISGGCFLVLIWSQLLCVSELKAPKENMAVPVGWCGLWWIHWKQSEVKNSWVGSGQVIQGVDYNLLSQESNCATESFSVPNYSACIWSFPGSLNSLWAIPGPAVTFQWSMCHTAACNWWGWGLLGATGLQKVPIEM